MFEIISFNAKEKINITFTIESYSYMENNHLLIFFP